MSVEAAGFTRIDVQHHDALQRNVKTFRRTVSKSYLVVPMIHEAAVKNGNEFAAELLELTRLKSGISSFPIAQNIRFHNFRHSAAVYDRGALLLWGHR
jgi:hypothetical protein